MLKLQCQVTLKQELEKTWRSQPDRVEADPKCSRKCFCSCSQRDRLNNLHRLNFGGTHKVLVKRHHHFWVAALLVAQGGEISRSWEGSVAAPGDGFNFNLCCTAPAWLQAHLSHFVKRRSWPCLFVCAGKGPRAAGEQRSHSCDWNQVLHNPCCRGGSVELTCARGSVWDWITQWKSSLFSRSGWIICRKQVLCP